MEKYTEAFCSITGNKVSIMQMRMECSLDPAAYEKNYKGHLFCPFCKVVPLTVVHANGLLYYRGHPHEVHSSNCWYSLDVRVVKSITRISGDIEKQALSQIDMLLRLTFDNNQKASGTKTANSNPSGSAVPVVHQWQTVKKRLPQYRIELLPELLDGDKMPEEISIFYGKVFCEVVDSKNPYNGVDFKVLIVKDAVTKKTIMGLTMSLTVWNHFTTDTQVLLQASQQSVHIAFLGVHTLSQGKALGLPYTCYLKTSTYLQVLED